MIRETCSCGASITHDVPVPMQVIEDWRANHRHDVSKIEDRLSPPVAAAEAVYTVTMDTTPMREALDDLGRYSAERARRESEFAADVSKIETSRHDDSCDCDECRWTAQRNAAVQHLDHCRDLYCGGCEVDTEDEPLTWRDHAERNHGLPGEPAERTQQPLMDESTEPPPGTPVWWDGEWFMPQRSVTNGNYYRSPTRSYQLAYMPGAVPALTPEQVDEQCRADFGHGVDHGRYLAAEDVAEFMESRKWSPSHLFYQDVMRAARGGER